jgi:AraC-like DNA-binding protein
MSKLHIIKPEGVPQVRAMCLAPFVDVARHLGLDPFALLRKAKIRPEVLADPETRIAASAVIKLVDETVRLSHCEALGLLMAESRSFASLGPISLLLQHCETVRDALGSLVRHQRMLGDLLHHALDDDGETATVRIELLPGYGPRPVTEFAVSMLVRSLREMSQDRWQPESVHFRHSVPADLQAYRRHFQCPIQFDSDFDGFRSASASMDIANPAANAIMADHAERCLELFAAQQAVDSVADQVRHALLNLLGRCSATIDSVADGLDLHPRMLQRLLEKEGATFAALLNETRRELAVRYLATSGHSVTDVGLLLGYSTLSSFSRWFTAEFGRSPAAWRNAERGAPVEASGGPAEASGGPAEALCREPHAASLNAARSGD